MDSELDFNALLNDDLKSSFNNVTMSLLEGQEEEPPLPYLKDLDAAMRRRRLLSGHADVDEDELSDGE